MGTEGLRGDTGRLPGDCLVDFSGWAATLLEPLPSPVLESRGQGAPSL